MLIKNNSIFISEDFNDFMCEFYDEYFNININHNDSILLLKSTIELFKTNLENKDIIYILNPKIKDIYILKTLNKKVICIFIYNKW